MKLGGERRTSLTQTIDLMPTFLDLYDAPIPDEVQGYSLIPILKKDTAQRSAGMFGYWGGGINIVDGQYTYFCYPKDMLNQDLYQYTLMPTHMTKLVTVEELKSASLAGPFEFTKELPVLRVAHKSKAGTKTHSFHFPEKMEDTQSVIYDVKSDPGQTKPITDKNMTRFNITLNEGINFVIFCLKNMWGGEIFVPKIPSYKITELAKAISPSSKLKIIGIRPGEKTHEEMISSSESLNTIEFKNYFVICPNSELINWSKNKYIKTNKAGKSCEGEFSYNSKDNKNFLKASDLKKIIKANLSDIELK